MVVRSERGIEVTMTRETIDIILVTQEDWDRAQKALRAALEFVKRHTPPLSTAGTSIDLQQLIVDAIITDGPCDV